MFFSSYKSAAKEVAQRLRQTIQVGLVNTGDSFETISNVAIPSSIFKDIYISGFVEGFVMSFLALVYNGRSWTRNTTKLGYYFLEIYKNIGMTSESEMFNVKLKTDRNFLIELDKDKLYEKGIQGAQTLVGAALGRLKPNDPDPILIKAKRMAEAMPNILGNETPKSKLCNAIIELTISERLKK
jgi:hypothetical protein